MKIKDKVKVTSRNAFTGKVGIIIAIVYEGKRKEYVVQFRKPIEWCWFSKKELLNEKSR